MTRPRTGGRFTDVDALLADARTRIERLTPEQAKARVDDGARIVDIRPAWQREQTFEIPGSVIVERNHLEWRLHPTSDARIDLAGPDQRWVVMCTEGYTSSLAADSLRSLGIDAADVVGGVTAWREAGLPVATTVTAPDTVVISTPTAGRP